MAPRGHEKADDDAEPAPPAVPAVPAELALEKESEDDRAMAFSKRAGWGGGLVLAGGWPGAGKPGEGPESLGGGVVRGVRGGEGG